MQKYGLKIGKVGLEFTDKASRDKALTIMTNCATVAINDSDGIVYGKEGDLAFGVYDRDNKEVLVKCQVCDGIFSNITCSKREVPGTNWKGEIQIGETDHKYICDGCEAVLIKKLEVAKAKQVLNEE